MTETNHERLKRLRAARGFKTAEAFAESIRMSGPTYRSYENGARPITLKAAQKIGPALGTSWQDLMLGESRSEAEREALEVTAARQPMTDAATTPPAGALYGARDLPILGHVRGGVTSTALFFEQGTPTAYTYRPHYLIGIREAYSVYMVGDSMLPRYKPGELLHVNPILPAQPGDDVVIQQTTGEAFIKELVRRTAKGLRTLQHNPRDEIEFPAGAVTAVHVVAGSTKIRV